MLQLLTEQLLILKLEKCIKRKGSKLWNPLPTNLKIVYSESLSLTVFHHNGSIHIYKVNEEKEKRQI